MAFFDFLKKRASAPPRIPELGDRAGEFKDNNFDQLLADRAIFLQTDIDDEAANVVIAKLLFLQMSDRKAPITLFVDSRGGSVTASFAILETIDFLSCPVHTYCLGFAAGMATQIMAHGRRRFALVNSEMKFARTIVELSGEPAGSEDIAAYLQKVNTRIVTTFVKDTGRDVETVRLAMEREKFFTSLEARDFGLIDEVITKQ